MSKISELLTDAQKMRELHPDTFEAPTKAELDAIKPNSHVKICAEGERFWVLVESIDGEAIVGFIDNDLICSDSHGLFYGDLVEFEKRHIYSIL